MTNDAITAREQYGQTIKVSSGFELFIKPLPPYYKDLIDQEFPLPKYPRRKIELLSGDMVDWPYEPPEEELTKEHEDFDLYVRWHFAHETIENIKTVKKLARIDYLLSMCVDIVDGKYNVEDTEWADRLEAAFTDFKVPSHYGRRYLLFLKHIVIITTEEMNMVVQLCTSPEVAMKGILNALEGFQNIMEEGRHN